MGPELRIDSMDVFEIFRAATAINAAPPFAEPAKDGAAAHLGDDLGYGW